MTDAYLRFDYPNVGYVLDRQEDATVRYDFERELDVGQRVQLLTPGGTVFAIAEIEDVWTCPLRLAYADMVFVDGRSHPATDVHDLASQLNEHYADHVIKYDDEVTLVYFDIVQVGGST